MKQTAVEWYEKQIWSLQLKLEKKQISIGIYAVKRVELCEKAKEMFKEQITNCFDHGDLVGRASVIREINPNDKVVLKYPEISAEEYYHKTFKSE